jgi:hypothetical protein
MKANDFRSHVMMPFALFGHFEKPREQRLTVRSVNTEIRVADAQRASGLSK